MAACTARPALLASPCRLVSTQQPRSTCSSSLVAPRALRPRRAATHRAAAAAAASPADAAPAVPAVRPEAEVPGMTEFLDSLKWDSNGLVVAIAQHADTGEVLMQAFADRAAVCETLQTG